MEKIFTKEAPQAIGPYSQGIAAAGTVYTSGQIAIDPSTGKMVDGGIEEQTERVCKNLIAILDASGLTAEDTVKTTCFITDMKDFPKVNAVYEKYFTGKPARSCVQVAALPKSALVEIEAIAQKRL